MPDLAVVQLTPGIMTENLTRSLSEDGRHPWAFNKYLRTMSGIREGVNVAFLRVTRPDGKPVGRSGNYPPDVVVHRLVLGEVVVSLDEVPDPFFTKPEPFPHEFWFELLTDQSCDPPVSLEELSSQLNDLLPGLGLDKQKLVEVLSNGRSAKVGMFFDGQPRRVDYFADKQAEPTQRKKDRREVPAAGRRSPGAPLQVVADQFAEAVSEAGLVFSGVNEDMPRAFLAGVLAKRFVLLTGLSGSGKTQIARALGQWLGSDADGPRHLVVPVRADWTTPEPLLGYEDALLPVRNGSRSWSVPPALEFMLRAHRSPEDLFLLVLDEMNLAHVERYFADVLSGMESHEPVLPNLDKDEDGNWYPKQGEVQLIPLPDNLLVVGTVNVDETTYQFSPKVLDRSFSFEFRVATDELDGDLAKLRPVSAADELSIETLATVCRDADWHQQHPPSDQADLEGILRALHEQLSTIGLEFGHRSFREALRMAAVLEGCGVDAGDTVADIVIMTKVLPRIHGSRRQLEPFLDWLLLEALEGDPDKPRYPLVARKANRMRDSLLANQYAGFAE